MKNIRVLLVDDHALLRAGLCSVLGPSKGFEVVGEAVNGLQAIERVAQLRPDLVTMDLHMPAMCGADATRQIVSRNPLARVLVVTTYCTSNELGRALSAGALGAVSKSVSGEALRRAMREVAAGRRFLTGEISRILDTAPQMICLSTRQQEILESISRGLSNRDISLQLGISLDMVKEHAKALFAKLGVANRTEAVSVALSKHLLDSERLYL